MGEKSRNTKCGMRSGKCGTTWLRLKFCSVCWLWVHRHFRRRSFAVVAFRSLRHHVSIIGTGQKIVGSQGGRRRDSHGDRPTRPGCRCEAGDGPAARQQLIPTVFERIKREVVARGGGSAPWRCLYSSPCRSRQICRHAMCSLAGSSPPSPPNRVLPSPSLSSPKLCSCCLP